MFNPNEQRNQHYVPVFWQRRFAGPDGVLYGLRAGRVQPVSAKKQMSGDWLYTTFDEKGIASNALERALSNIEGGAAQIFEKLDGGATGTYEDQITLRWFVAFSACRHPDTMSAAHRRAKELAYAIADVHASSLEEFCKSLSRFGVSIADATATYEQAKLSSEADLLMQAEEVQHLAPTDPALPQQIAVTSETIERVLFAWRNHIVTIIDAPPGETFLLGDTPFSAQSLDEFIVPISSATALLWQPGNTPFEPWTRRAATPEEVERSRRAQIDNAREVTVGPTRDSLEKYLT